jgi:hypothetical protein
MVTLKVVENGSDQAIKTARIAATIIVKKRAH